MKSPVVPASTDIFWLYLLPRNSLTTLLTCLGALPLPPCYQ